MNINKALFAGLMAVSLCSAQSVNISGKVMDTGSTPLIISDLHIATPIAGWLESQNAYLAFDSSTAYNLLFDSLYLLNNSLVNGFQTTYGNGAESTTVKVLIVNYGTAANAAALWDTLTRSRVDNNHKIVLPGFSTSAVGQQTYHELYAYAHFDKFYFQLDFKNYPDNNKAIADATAFLSKYKSIGGRPLPGAVVSLEKGGQTATTGADGSFTLTGTAGVIGQNKQFLVPKFSATICNGILCVNVKEKSAVVITTYNLRGQAVSTLQRTMEAGAHSITLPRRGAGVYLYKVNSGKSEFLIKGHSIGRVSGSVQGPSSNALTKQARTAVAINDVIAVTKSGYLNYRVAVSTSDTSGVEIQMIACEGTVTDIEGNAYQTVKIGNQVWTAENLRTTKLNDGTAILHVTAIQGWTLITTPAYVIYNNTTDADSIRKFGVLYNWMTVDTKKLAPAGWHVPDTTEWNTLQNYLIANGYNWDGTTTDNKIAKSLAAKADWLTCTDSGTVGNDLTRNNGSGFSALPGGSRYYDVNFNYIGQIGYWWTSTAADDAHAYYRMLNTCLDFLDMYLSINSCGFSIRLVKD